MYRVSTRGDMSYHYRMIADSIDVTRDVEDMLNKHVKEGNIVEMSEDEICEKFMINNQPDGDLSWWDVRELYIDDAKCDEDIIYDMSNEKLIEECKRRFKTQKEMLEYWRMY